jgi:hypothetical protein
MRQAPRSSTVHLRAIVAALLVLGLVLVVATVARAASLVSIDSGPSGPTNDTLPTFAFTVDLTATTVECSIDQGTEAYVPCSGTYAPAVPLPEGDYTFRVRASDGVDETIATQDFTIDTTRPSLSIDSGPPDPTNDTTPSFTFTTDAQSVECSVDQGTPAYGSCASPYRSAALSDGTYTFRVLATDAAGNQSSAEQAFSVDATPPSVSIDSGPSGPTNDPLPEFGFTVDGTATTVECSIDRGAIATAYVPCSGPTYTPLASLPDGRYTFSVRASDALGNERTRTQDFSIDNQAPSLTIDTGPRGPTNDTTPSFGFTTDATRIECSIDHGTPTYRSCTTSSSYTAAQLADGSYVFHVRASDAVGNQAEAFRAFTVDTVPPSLSIGFGPSGTTSDSTPLFGFSAEVGATAQCSIDQGTEAYGPCASTTTHAAGAPLADGAYVFRVQATDRAGNQTTATRTFTVDTVPDAPGTDPTPPATTPTSTRSKPQLLSPFPLVRISGTLTATGARIRLLSVRAPHGALVQVTVSPACGKQRHAARRCRALHASGTLGRRAVIDFRTLARAYRSGTVIVVRVSRTDRIGKYTRFTILRGKAPRRVDQCLMPGATRGSRCPSS